MIHKSMRLEYEPPSEPLHIFCEAVAEVGYASEHDGVFLHYLSGLDSESTRRYGSTCMLGVWCMGFVVWGLGFGVRGLGSGVRGLGLRVGGSGFEVEGLGCRL